MITLLDFQGRAVRLTAERREHILDHAEMHGMEEQIAHTLREPELVVGSRSDDAVLLRSRYYRETVVGDRWLCVVVKYLVQDAFVLTALSD